MARRKKMKKKIIGIHLHTLSNKKKKPRSLPSFPSDGKEKKRA